MIFNDPDGPWTAAAYLAEDESFEGVQHGIGDSGGTLCGISEDEVAIVRRPFWGDGAGDCRTCAFRLAEAATTDP
ncbi:hypothetical protein AB0H36_45505 [Kribbella sp. NPDC050820]|uniref:hypothetical protein n=1 Tax=Kribbella sp. NPDC050820 TaxID=3155408 RepID=UPI0033C282EA